jgi:hypothetical protein
MVLLSAQLCMARWSKTGNLYLYCTAVMPSLQTLMDNPERYSDFQLLVCEWTMRTYVRSVSHQGVS